VGSESIRISCRVLFGIGQNVNFAMRLFEGLSDLVVLKPAPPTCNHLNFLAERMPEAYQRFGRKPLQRSLLVIYEFAVVPYAGHLSLAFAKMPDQPCD